MTLNNGDLDSRVCMNERGCLSILARRRSQAGCSFVKALYCISFLCQSPFPVAVPCQTTMTLCFLQVAWRQVCHEPQGLTASHRATSEPPTPSGLSSPSPTLPSLGLTSTSISLNSPVTATSSPLSFISPLLPPAPFSYLPPPFTPFPPLCVPRSTPPSSLFTSLPPSSLCPGVQVRRGPDHTLRGDFCNYCQ
ncbi:unnamed protein product [Pleuronectes platessa]|uniref:Uncharacterized protein n=1 Tax=Pleuronectes platessa TaxID=8262 RepID=A0A9N7Z7T4_PLEPL|nr:unnamed protein product [Pleuronectes platessa]